MASVPEDYGKGWETFGLECPGDPGESGNGYLSKPGTCFPLRKKVSNAKVEGALGKQGELPLLGQVLL